MLNIKSNLQNKKQNKNHNNYNVKLSFQYKIYTKNKVQIKQTAVNEGSIPVIYTRLKDKNNRDIYLYDILKLDSKLEDGLGIARRNNYFICIFDNKKGKIDFLYFDKIERDFIWFDDYLENSLHIVDNAVRCLTQKDKFPFKCSTKKIISLIDGTNKYFTT